MFEKSEYKYLCFGSIALKYFSYVFSTFLLLAGLVQAFKFKNVYVVISAIVVSFLFFIFISMISDFIKVFLSIDSNLKKIVKEKDLDKKDING